jgi:hypothetical protein
VLFGFYCYFIYVFGLLWEWSLIFLQLEQCQNKLKSSFVYFHSVFYRFFSHSLPTSKLKTQECLKKGQVCFINMSWIKMFVIVQGFIRPSCCNHTKLARQLCRSLMRAWRRDWSAPPCPTTAPAPSSSMSQSM